MTNGAGTAFLRANGHTLTNSSTIVGDGLVSDTGGALNNSGTVNANVSGGTLTLESGVTNTGTLEATNNGTLTLLDNSITNTGGNITASGGTVNLDGATVTGGTLNASAPGSTLRTFGGATLNGVTISSGSTYLTGTSETTVVTGTLTNTGATFKLDGSAGNAIFQANTDVTISGGTVTMISGTSSDAFLCANGHTLTSTALIQGAGIIDDTGGSLVNNATVNANVSGGTLTLDSSVTNTGTLEATGGGTLTLLDNTITNTGGNITANGGTVNLQGATIDCGTLTASAGTMQTAVGQAVEESDGTHRSRLFNRPDARRRYFEFLQGFMYLVRLHGKRWFVREFDLMHRAVFRPEGSAFGNTQTEPFQIVTVGVNGDFSTFSPEFLGVRDPRIGDFVIGHLAAGPIERADTNLKFLALKAEIEAGVAKCRDACEYFSVCGGGAPANKLGELGTMDATVTRFCECTVMGAADLVLSLVDEQVLAD
jgi:radical SAM protein with 4Fe4S-binding SPASM domain